MTQKEEVFVLLQDGAMTSHSIPEPFNVAVRTKEEAEKFIEGKDPMFSRYTKVRIFDSYEEGLKWRFDKE